MIVLQAGLRATASLLSFQKRRKPYKRKPKEKANSACEAVEKMLIEKKISHKINYDVLRNLNKENELQKPSDCQPEAPTVVEPVSNLIQAVQPSIPVRYTGRKRYLAFICQYASFKDFYTSLYIIFSETKISYQSYQLKE
jgi:signal recognition particle GTPase